MNKRTMTLVISLLLVALVAVGGTLAWLMDKTDPVVNTFTAGDVDITLVETTGDEYHMVPGNTIAKDPKVTVLADSEACWLYVKVEASDNFADFMEYDMADGWNKLAGVDNVFYREVADTDAAQEFAVIKDNSVTVKVDVTKEMMDALEEATYPNLTFTAYAIQKANVATAADGWTALNTPAQAE